MLIAAVMTLFKLVVLLGLFLRGLLLHDLELGVDVENLARVCHVLLEH